jgi:hypothetical protein
MLGSLQRKGPHNDLQGHGNSFTPFQVIKGLVPAFKAYLRLLFHNCSRESKSLLAQSPARSQSCLCILHTAARECLLFKL